MLKQILATSTVVLGFMIAFGSCMTIAQTNATRQPTTIEDIRLAVVQNVGSQDKAVEVSQTGNVLLISRINSNMNGASHQLINNESISIGSVVSKAIANRSEYENIHTIRVQYLDRSGSPPKDKVMDSVEFRKGQDGEFDMHTT
jgi:hypothetical protein